MSRAERIIIHGGNAMKLENGQLMDSPIRLDGSYAEWGAVDIDSLDEEFDRPRVEALLFLLKQLEQVDHPEDSA